MTVTGTRIRRNITSRYLRAVLSQDIAYFDGGKGGSVATHVTTSGNTIQTSISEKLGLTLQAVSACVASIIIALISQWKLTLITITVAPVIVGVIGIAVSLDTKIEVAMLAAFDEAAALAEDILSSMRNVHAFWMRPRLLEKYDVYLEKAHAHGRKKSLVFGLFYSTEFFLTYCAFALAFWQGVHMYASGEIAGPGTVIT
jgi:ATP-binding cassette subfamily B (MDR/TAP) protein 1